MKRMYFIILVIMVGINYCDYFSRFNKPKEKPEVFSLLGDIGVIKSVAISKDGRYVISGGEDKTIRVWETETGKVKELKGHTGSVTYVAISLDDKYVVSWGKDNIIRVWDIETGKEIKELEVYIKGVTSVAISKDGRFVVFGSEDNIIRVWDIETGKEVKELKGHTKGVTSVAISTDGKFVVSASDDTTIRVWDIETGKEIKRFKGHSGISSLVITTDGKYVLSNAAYKYKKDENFITYTYIEIELTLWDINIGKEVWIVRENYKYYFDEDNNKKQEFYIAMSLDGKYIVFGENINNGNYIVVGENIDKVRKNTIRLLDGKTGKEIKRFEGVTEAVNSLAISMNGRYVVSGNKDSTVSLWDIETGKEIRRFIGYTDWVTSVVFSPDGRYVVSGSGNGAVRVWDLKTGKEIKRIVVLVEEEYINRIKTSTDSVLFGSNIDLTISPDAKYVISNEGVVVGSKDTIASEPGSFCTITLWEIMTGKKIMEREENGLFDCSTYFSYDGRFFFIRGSELYGGFKIIGIIDVKTGKDILSNLISSLLGESGGGLDPIVNSVDISPDNRHIIYGDNEGKIVLLDINTGMVIKSLKGHTDSVSSVIFSPDGKYVVSMEGGEDNTIRVWNIKTDKEINKFEGYNSVKFSPDSKYLVLWGKNKRVELWNIETGEEVKRFEGHTDDVFSVIFSPDGKYVVSKGVGEDNTIRVWDIKTGKDIKIFEGQKVGNNCVIFSRDGKYLVSISKYRTIILWDINTGKEIAQFIGYKDGEWVILTPEGYYNASKNGEKYLKVRVGNEVYDIEKYRDKFYKPEIVKARLEGKQ